MNVIYRIYQITSDINNSFCCDKTIIAQDTMICNNADEFKEAIRLTFGDDIKFKHTKGMQIGDIFCSIISYNCDNAEEYIRVDDYICDNCGKTYKTNPHSLIRSYCSFRLEKICKPLFDEKAKEIENYHYCCGRCRNEHEEKLKQEFTKYAKDNNYVSDFWVDRYDEYKTGASGYIYMITKKSTGEFYVGQTNAIPMFRWVQHLKTERFKAINITDYQYQVLEKVEYKKDLNDREAYWINKKYKENPELCLNIQMPKVKEKDLFDIMEEQND